jgi:hypothetical protein
MPNRIIKREDIFLGFLRQSAFFISFTILRSLPGPPWIGGKYIYRYQDRFCLILHKSGLIPGPTYAVALGK